jgi:HEPN domain-containing protein
MPTKDPAHWLYRLEPAEWLAAARTELHHADEALARRAIRPAVTHARRAAGMAANALLWQDERPAWGRSYMEHVTALVDDTAAPEAVRAAARALRDTPPAPPSLVKLGPPDRAAVVAALTIVKWAEAALNAVS